MATYYEDLAQKLSEISIGPPQISIQDDSLQAIIEVLTLFNIQKVHVSKNLKQVLLPYEALLFLLRDINFDDSYKIGLIKNSNFLSDTLPTLITLSYIFDRLENINNNGKRKHKKSLESQSTKKLRYDMVVDRDSSEGDEENSIESTNDVEGDNEESEEDIEMQNNDGPDGEIGEEDDADVESVGDVDDVDGEDEVSEDDDNNVEDILFNANGVKNETDFDAVSAIDKFIANTEKTKKSKKEYDDNISGNDNKSVVGSPLINSIEELNNMIDRLPMDLDMIIGKLRLSKNKNVRQNTQDVLQQVFSEDMLKRLSRRKYKNMVNMGDLSNVIVEAVERGLGKSNLDVNMHITKLLSQARKGKQ